MNRGERRRRNKVIYDRRSKLFYQIWHHPYIPCNEDEIDEYPYFSIYKNKRKAKTWKEFQEKDPSMHLYKNTRTIWHHGYWTKFDRKIMNKQSRKNAKLDLMNGDGKPFERYKYQ